MNRKFLAIVVFPAVLTLASGCAAKYQTIRKGQGGENQGSGAGNGEDAVPAKIAPSAQVEVVVDGKIVVKVKAGTPFVIRPSESTMDPDNRDEKDCRNPGIVQAVYTPGPDAAKTAARTGPECTSLEVSHTFPQPGVFEIAMTVTSDEQETATSKMTLEVVPADSPDSATDGGFIVKADPLIAETGENIVFAGDCAAAKEITWNFKDPDNKTPGKGAQVAKAYNTPGQYQVEAECLNEQDEILTGEISVVVVPKKQTTSPEQPGNNADQGDNTQKPGDGEKPGDNTPPGNSNPPGDNTPPGNSNPPGDNTPPGNSNPPGDNTPPGDDDSDKPDDSSPGNPGQNPGQIPYQGKI
jgi:hypothetical protein